MKYKNKEYKTIIWDWRSTIYDPVSEKIYNWFEKYIDQQKDVDHILLSWTSNIPKRTELIYSFPIVKKFKKIYITSDKKREVFEKIFDEDKIDPDTTIIIGDNVNDEIAVAKDLAVDSELVSAFVKTLGLQEN